MQIQKKQSNSKRRKRIIIILAVIVLLVLGYGLYAWKAKLPPFKEAYDPSGTAVNMDRTDTEKAQSQKLQDDPKAKTQNDQTDTPATPSTDQSTGKQQANVLLSRAGITNGTVSAGGVVTNVVESDGQCSYVFTNGSSTVTKVSQTMTNPSSTSCAVVSFPSSELAASGTWQVYIQYDSSASSGKSNIKEFTK